MDQHKHIEPRAAMYTHEELERLLDQANRRIEELEDQAEDLLGKLADPKLISLSVDERGAEIAVKPREEIMRHLFMMCAHAMGESKNFVECEFGPDGEGRWYVLTLRNYHGKTPGQIHAERVKELEDRIKELECP